MDLNRKEARLTETLLTEGKRINMALDLIRTHHQVRLINGVQVITIPLKALHDFYNETLIHLTVAEREAPTKMYFNKRFRFAYCLLLKVASDLEESLLDYESAYNSHSIVMDLQNYPALVPHMHYRAISLLERAKDTVAKDLNTATNQAERTKHELDLTKKDELVTEHAKEFFQSASLLNDGLLFEMCSFVINSPILTTKQIETAYAASPWSIEKAILAAVALYTKEAYAAASVKAFSAKDSPQAKEFPECAAFLDDALIGF